MSGSDDPPVLLTYGWCRTSYVVLRSLAARGVAVHVVDASPFAMCRASRRAASFRRVRDPFAAPDGFVEDVVAALRATGARVLIPGHDDALVLARARAALPDGVVLPVADPDLLALAGDKSRVLEEAAAAGVPVPLTVRPRSAVEVREAAATLRYPAVVKTRIGNSAKGVRFAADATSLVAAWEGLVARHALPPESLPVLQEHVPGTGYGTCFLYERGRCRAAFAERYLRCKDGETGTSVFRESVRAPDLLAHGRALLDRLRWHGVVHLDFLRDDATGRAALLEANPRFWGALDLAVRSGVDFPWLLYRLAADGSLPDAAEGRAGVRSRWLVGEGLHLVNHLRRLRVGGALGALGSLLTKRASGHDDFDLSDPLPLLGEGFDYLQRFLRSGSTNPVGEGMIR